jgi:hypothetical protein
MEVVNLPDYVKIQPDEPVIHLCSPPALPRLPLVPCIVATKTSDQNMKMTIDILK